MGGEKDRERESGERGRQIWREMGERGGREKKKLERGWAERQRDVNGEKQNSPAS